jgi:hypothetical protein
MAVTPQSEQSDGGPHFQEDESSLDTPRPLQLWRCNTGHASQLMEIPVAPVAHQ